MLRRWLSLYVSQPQIKWPTFYVPALPLWLMLTLLWLLLAVGLWVTLALPMPGTYGVFEVNRPSPMTIQSPRHITFKSEIRTEEERMRAENRVENLVYDRDFNIPVQQRQALNDLLIAITRIREDTTLSESAKIALLTSLPDVPEDITDFRLTETMARDILALDDTTWNTVRIRSLTLYDQALARYELELDAQAIQRLTERSLPNWTSTLEEPQGSMVRIFTTEFLRVNITLNEEKTEERRREAREAVEPVWVEVQEGETIVRSGEIVRPEIFEKLVQTGTLPQRSDWIDTGGQGLLAVLLALSFGLHLFFSPHTEGRKPRQLLTIVLTVVGTALIARLLLSIWADHSYTFPLAGIALLLAVVFHTQTALAGAVLLSLIVGLLDDQNLVLTITLLIGSTIAVYTVRNAERSLVFVLAGLFVSLATIAIQVAFWLSEQGSVRLDIQPLMYFALYGGLNGVLSAILALGLFSLVGHAAGVVTPLQLMELAHPSQPLIRRLIHEAPGTYYHSISVANLAEAAAEVTGADALLLRVGAYYHDIGKTIRPFFFTDNQIGRENVHNDLDPRTSAEIIVDHVREGIKMAQAARLPQPIIDFIATHHGTHIIQHFYQLALQQEDTVDIADFRYPGPIPWTREQGILMLADSVEATVRSKAQNNKLIPRSSHSNGHHPSGAQTLDDLVNTIIDDRVHNGQLDNTPLTLHDIVLIRQAFITSLQGIYHPRVDYTPQLVK